MSLTFSPIPGFPFHQITPDGDILDCVTGDTLPHYIAGPGYYMARLNEYDDDAKQIGRKLHYIHRLLATTYLPNPNNYREVDHIDRNKLNNALSNLRWCSHSLNCENKGLYVTNKLREHHICHDERDDRYYVAIKRNGVKIRRSYKTLEAAKAFRVSVLGT